MNLFDTSKLLTQSRVLKYYLIKINLYTNKSEILHVYKEPAKP